MSLYVEEVSKDVQLAETSIRTALRKKPRGIVPSELINSLQRERKQLSEDEIRQAIWRLVAAGEVDFSPDLKLKLEE
jgi:hypothetical protein